MKKILFFAFAFAASVLVFTACEKGNEPELIGTVYHYHGISSSQDLRYEHDLYLAMEDNGNLTMKWVGVKTSEDAEPVNLYMYNGNWEGDENGFHFHFEGKPQLPGGKYFDEWDTFDVDGWGDKSSCSFDYHINGATMAIFDGQIVED